MCSEVCCGTVLGVVERLLTHVPFSALAPVFRALCILKRTHEQLEGTDKK